MEWLRLSRCFVSKDNKDVVDISHVLLTGGRLSVVTAQGSEFLDVYARTVACGQASSLYVVERSGSCRYRMFADLDIAIKAEETTNAESILEEALDGLPASLSNGQRLCICNRESTTKAGFHIIWPDLYVDDAKARALRNEWIHALPTKFSSIIDESVYSNGGLRMPWSLKKGGDASGSYIPSKLVRMFGRASSTPPSQQMDVIDTLSRDVSDYHTIRRWIALSVLDAKEYYRRGAATKKAGSATPRASSNRRAQPPRGQAVEVNPEQTPEDDELAEFETAVSRLLSRDGPSVRVTMTIVDLDRLVLRTDSHACKRENREHSSNHVYYIIRRATGGAISLHQGCHAEECRVKGCVELESSIEEDFAAAIRPFVTSNIKKTTQNAKLVIRPKTVKDIAAEALRRMR